MGYSTFAAVDADALGYAGTMTTSISEFRHAVSAKLLEELQAPVFLEDSTTSQQRFSEFIGPALQLAKGGKRTRALLLAAGWQLFNPGAPLPISAGSAVEVYQLSALVHDDIIDEAETRRGIPAAHHQFARDHDKGRLLGRRERFGEKSALLLGDYLLSLASGIIASAEAISADARNRGIEIFNAMTAETAFGQFLDARAEFTELNHDAELAIAESMSVLLHKSARYSVELPLLIGAAIAGAKSSDLDQVSMIGRPLGEAFQLRDDELGIFGDPLVTGKPAGGDITEGKRTVLLALARDSLDATDLKILDGALGKKLSPTDVDTLRTLIVDCGAYEQHEAMIEDREQIAYRARQSLARDSEILDSLMKQLMGRRQ